MNVTIFNDVTAETALSWFDEEAAKHQGLYVDMDDPEQRKYVKSSAATIKGVLKAVDVARIQKVKEFRASVESEADYIKGRLEVANEPFTLLLDDWEVERKRVLDLAKEKKRQEELYIQIGLDHEFALLLDKSHAADKAEAERLRDTEIELRIESIKKEKAALEAREHKERLANAEHVRGVNRTILVALMQAGIAEEDAKTVVTLAARGLAGTLTINY